MIQDKKKISGARENDKKGSPPVLVIALAVAAGIVIGSAGTYILSRPSEVPVSSVTPAADGTLPAQTINIPAQTPPAGQFTPAPQPPGDAPPGKVWSPEHGHWHDAPAALTTPTFTPTPAPTLTPVPAPTPAPVGEPAEKK